MIQARMNPLQKQQLETELKETKDVRWYRRLKIIDLSSSGKTPPELAKMFNLTPATVRDYIKRFNTGGLCALLRSYSPGRPALIQLTKQQWEEILCQSPCQFELLETAARNWTQELLVTYCEKYLGVKITQPALCLLLKRHHISWNRGKLKVTSPDPLYTVKRERINELKKKVKTMN